MKFSRKYTRKHNRNGKTKKSKKGGKESRKKSPPFPISNTPRRQEDPQNNISRFRPMPRTPRPNTRHPNDNVPTQNNDIRTLLEMPLE